MKKVTYTLTTLIVVLISGLANAQQGFGTSTPDPSSVIDMVASDKGVLLPRVRLEDLTDIVTVPNPVNGLTVFNVPDPFQPFSLQEEGYFYWSTEKAQWVKVLDDYSGWALQGNAGTSPAGSSGPGTDFLGTTDDTDFQIKVGTSAYNNIMRVRNAKGHTQFGNWLNLSISPNLQDPDYILAGLSYTPMPASFAVQNNFVAADISGSQNNNTRSASYLNETSANTFYGDMNYTQVSATGYTGQLSASYNQLRINGGTTVAIANANGFAAANQSVVSIQSGGTLTGSPGVGSAASFGMFTNSGTVNGAAVGMQGRTSGTGAYNGIFAGTQGLITTSNFNNAAYGAQGLITGGTFNNTTGAALIGVDASITGGTFAAATSTYGLRSNVSASGVANGYGLYIEDVAGTVSQNGVYQAGTNDNNYFGGNTKIGTTGVASNKLHVAAASNPVRFEGLQATAATGESVLVTDATGVIKTIAPSAVAANNIYNANGTLLAARTVTTGTFPLHFANGAVRFSLSNTATDANASLLASNRANMRWGAGTSYLDIFQDTGAIGQIAVSGASTGLQVGSANGSSTPVYIMTNGTNRISVLANGNVGIGTDNMLGTANAAIKLAVNGSILTTSSTYADYVFEDYFEGSSTINADYKFKSLSEVEKFINENKHLPGVTGIEGLNKNENGEFVFNVSELSVQVLEKVEELYLHTIAQQKLLEAKDKEIQELKSTTQQMNERLERLEQLLLEKK